MGYVIAAIILVLIVGAAIAFGVVSASRRQRQAAIVAPDDNTPLGDTDQHAGEQEREGRTVGGQDAEHSGGTGRPVGSGYAGTGAVGEPDREGGPKPAGGEGGVGGEGEGSRPVGSESERLADRER
jgi:hypothetical protein